MTETYLQQTSLTKVTKTAKQLQLQFQTVTQQNEYLDDKLGTMKLTVQQ
jgi:hypothetical protein